MFADLKSDEPEREALIRDRGAGIFEPMPGRRMREYVVVPAAILADEAALGDWISRSIAFARKVKPKAASRARKKTPARKPARSKKNS